MGAAALVLSFIWNLFLRSAESFTFYNGELYGIYLATELTIQEQHCSKIFIIYANNQSTIYKIITSENGSGQHIFHSIMNSIDNLRLHSFAVKLHLVPAYIGIDSNKTAYKSAKKATR